MPLPARFTSSTTRFTAALLIAAAALAAHAQSAPAVADTSYVLPGGERVLELSLVVPGALPAVWDAFATEEGFRGWSAPVARIDLRPGGEIEASYDRNAQPGAPGNIRNRIVALVPQRLLVLQNVQAPPNAAFDVAAFQRTQTAIHFAAMGSGETRVTIQHAGYGSGEGFDGVYRYFKAGNTWVLQRLHQRFTKGAPLGWN